MTAAPRSIIIIGAGLGGLAAGIYGRLNGYAILQDICKADGKKFTRGTPADA
jgi:thioredoxin reductase